MAFFFNREGEDRGCRRRPETHQAQAVDRPSPTLNCQPRCPWHFKVNTAWEFHTAERLAAVVLQSTAVCLQILLVVYRRKGTCGQLCGSSGRQRRE